MLAAVLLQSFPSDPLLGKLSLIGTRRSNEDEPF